MSREPIVAEDDTEEKGSGDTKRRSRNISEKKRRDQFNVLINELSEMVSTRWRNPNRKMDKSTVLRNAISFLKSNNEVISRSHTYEIDEHWKPAFLCNEEFTHLMLEALDGFVVVLSSLGQILYVSESITALLGHSPKDMVTQTIYDLVCEEDRNEIFNVLSSCPFPNDQSNTSGTDADNERIFTCRMRKGPFYPEETMMYECLILAGQYQRCKAKEGTDSGDEDHSRRSTLELGSVFVATACLQMPHLIREMSITDSAKSEFTSRHSLEWKFLFLDHRAPPVIGYLPFEVLGTSGYDYLHIDDLDKVIACHKSLMQSGEGTSCYYRFLTKGQQWIWLQTRYYITYHQWNSKPEFIVCVHTVVRYEEVRAQLWRERGAAKHNRTDKAALGQSDCSVHSVKHSAPGSVISASGGSSTWVQRPAGNEDVSFTEDASRSSTAAMSGHSLSHFSSQSTPSAAGPVTVSVGFQLKSGVQQSAVCLTAAQSELQEELCRKQQVLQEQILHQQQELHRVHEQLMRAQLVPRVPCLPCCCTTTSTVSTFQQSSDSNACSVHYHPVVSSANFVLDPPHTLPSIPHQHFMPIQFTSQQTQIFFNTNFRQPNEPEADSDASATD